MTAKDNTAPVPAAYARPLPDGRVLCELCPHGCVIPQSGRGLCGARVNEAGTLFAESYGRVTSIALDPTTKKPFAHFHPEGYLLSIGSYGCNLRCGFCQNHALSMGKAPYDALTPRDIAALSLKEARRGNIGIALTYNEPLIAYEFARDCARLVRENGQVSALVTNGYINPEPLRALLPWIDAMNIDLKAFTEAFYRGVGGTLPPVMESIRIAAARCHVEVTTLVIPGLNDAPEEMDALAAWLAGVDPDITLHISRFFPRHRMLDRPATPVETIRALVDVARRHLRRVVPGNCPELT